MQITAICIRGLAFLASKLYDTQGHNTAKNGNFSELEVETKTREEDSNQIVLFGSLKSRRNSMKSLSRSIPLGWTDDLQLNFIMYIFTIA